MEKRTIESCPGYAITDDGQVWSFKSNKFLKQKIDKYGYPCVNLSIGGKTVSKTIHRLVAEAFIPNPEHKLTVNHKDENKLNNCVENLEWMTVAENNKYGTHYKRSSETQKGKIVSEETRKKISEAKTGKELTEEHKEKIKLSCLTGKDHPLAKGVYSKELDEVFDCVSDVARKYGIDPSSIVACCRGRVKSAGKHPATGEKLTWKYCLN